MNEKLKSILSEIAAKMLEQMAFIFAVPEDGRGSVDYDEVVVANVAFKGPFSGALKMMVADQVLEELARNMLGFDEQDDVTLQQQHDALKETINIVCGNLLPVMAGKEAIFDIAAPEVIDDNGAIKQAVDNGNGERFSAIARLSVDDEPCDLFLTLEGEPELVV